MTVARMPPRDELLLIIDLTSTIIRAGVGVKDLIDAPKAVRVLPWKLGPAYRADSPGPSRRSRRALVAGRLSRRSRSRTMSSGRRSWMPRRREKSWKSCCQ